jgi:hypothetical protein
MMFIIDQHTASWTKKPMMRKMLAAFCAFAAVACYAIVPARAETPQEWVALGARVHGAFGSFLPVGLDALQRLNAEPRG